MRCESFLVGFGQNQNIHTSGAIPCQARLNTFHPIFFGEDHICVVIQGHHLAEGFLADVEWDIERRMANLG